MIKCDCGQTAKWIYMPGFNGNSYFCDDCVNRGCTCNHRYAGDGDYKENPPTDRTDWKWIEEGKSWVNLDEKGREYPCCEYDYEDEGFEED